jgi:hypothetical protein
MPGPSTNLSGSSHSHIPADACTSDYIDILRSFKDGSCMVATVPEGKTSIFTALNLGSSVVTFERIIEDKCDVELYLPYKPGDCVVQLTAATPVQPIKMPGRYRMCITPANPDALIQQKDVDFGSSSCCVIDTKCQPAAVVPPSPPVQCPVTGLPAPLVAPFVWQGQTFESTSAFVSAVLQSTGGGTFNFATATFTLPPNSTCPSLVVSAVPVAPPAPPKPCPSIALPGGGFMYHPADILDPAATTVVGDCVTAGSVLGYIYPTAGVGHTVAVEDCVGGTLGWAQNCSECACSSVETAETGEKIIVTGTGLATVTTTANGFNVNVPPISLCTELTNFIAAATGVAPQPTDELMVVRNGLCAKVSLAELLADKWFANTSMTYNPANGEITLVQRDETGAVANTFTIDIGPFVETPWSSASTNSILVTNGGTNGHTPELNVNVSGAAGNALSVTTQGLYVPTPVVPDSPALVVTKNGSTAGVVQSGTLDHTVDILVETTEVYVNGVAVPDSDTSATNRRYDITIPVCTDVSAQTPTELMPGSVFAATDPDDCERKLFKIPDCPVCPAPAIEQSGSLVQLDQAALDLIKVNVAGGGPLPTLGSAVLENIGSMVVPGAIAAENFDITFTAASTDPHIIFVSNVMGSASFETFSFIGVTTGNGNATLLDSTTLVNGALRNRSMVIVVQPTASGAINVRYNANRMTNWMNTVHPIINANIANPVLGYTKRSWNPGPGNTFPSTFPSGQTDTTGIVEPTRNGYASSSSIVTAVVARHLKGWDAAGNNMRQPPNADNQPGIEQQSSTSPPQTTVGFAALNQISQQNNTFVCPQSIHVLNNPTDGSMIINRDGSGFGTTYYIELGQNAVTGGGEDTVSTQNISLSPKVCGGCCEASNGIVHFEPATVVATLEPTADIELTFIVNGASSTISLVNDGATVKTHKVPVPPVQQLVAVPCPSGIDASASLLVKVNTLSAAGNSVTIDTLTLKGAAL